MEEVGALAAELLSLIEASELVVAVAVSIVFTVLAAPFALLGSGGTT